MAYRAGLVAMLGKPNVGKSTLLNALVGHKVSIVSNKPQTTRRRVLGIVQNGIYEAPLPPLAAPAGGGGGREADGGSSENTGYQIAFIDTPGIHEPHTTLGRTMVEAARQALYDVDLILYVADASKKPDEVDRQIARLLRPDKTPLAPVLLCLNKMDLLAADLVNPQVEAYTKLFETEEYMLTTATKNHNLDKLFQMILAKMPEGEPRYPEDEYTDQPMRMLVSEIIREKVLQQTRQEVPHATAVSVDQWEEENGLVRIEATVIVEKQGQKAILIGKHGQFVKAIGTAARLEIQQMLEKPIYLELYVKVREDWRMNPRILQELEYTE